MSLINWVEKKLTEKSIQYTRNNDVLSIESKNGNQISVLILEQEVKTSFLQTMINARGKIDFLVKDKNLFLDDSIYALLQSKRIGYGDIGDIFSLPDHEGEVYKYLNKELSFFVKTIKNHSNVSNFKRINDKAFIIERRIGKTLKIIISNEYIFTEQKLEEILNNYGNCDLIHSSNPNAQNPGFFVVKGKNIEVVKLRKLLGMLNGYKM